jgi:hypothetical protein
VIKTIEPTTFDERIADLRRQIGYIKSAIDHTRHDIDGRTRYLDMAHQAVNEARILTKDAETLAGMGNEEGVQSKASAVDRKLGEAMRCIRLASGEEVEDG